MSIQKIRCSASDCPGHDPVDHEVCDPKPRSESNVFKGLYMNEVSLNVEDEQIVQNVHYAIRQQHPQVWSQPMQPDRICIVGGGPSLADTERDLVSLVHAGAKLVTVNGSYQWCLQRNLRPTAQIVVDARSSNARFLDPPVPECRYFLASQCHPDTWDMVRDRKHVAIFHSAAGNNPTLKPILDEYYLGNWTPVSGGSTVVLRAIALLRTMGYLRFDLFGVDSCWGPAGHHAYEQPENDTDQRFKVHTAPTLRPDLGRDFWVSPWHLAQAEDFVNFIRAEGEHFLLRLHGNGMLAYLLESGAEVPMPDNAEARTATQSA